MPKTSNKQKFDYKLLENLCNANGIAACEEEVRDVLLGKLKTKSDDVFCDGIGSIIFQKNPSSPKKKLSKTKNQKSKNNNNYELPRIMLAAHMDEVGYVVKEISELGQLFLKPIGAVQSLAQFAHKVNITTEKGKQYKGLLQATFQQNFNSKKGTNASFASAEIPGKAYVDLGLNNDKEVDKLGIQVGDMVTFDSHFETLTPNNIVMGKAMDNRVGCYVMAKVIENLNKTKHNNTVFGVATSSEEVGVRGAKTSTETVVPDAAIVIDTNYCNNEMDRSRNNQSQIGKGPIILSADRRCVGNKKMVALARNTAKNLNINIQNDALLTSGTDAGEIHKANGGTPAVTICIPMRYCHSTYSIVDINDVSDAIQLITEMTIQLNSKNCEDMRSFI